MQYEVYTCIIYNAVLAVMYFLVVMGTNLSQLAIDDQLAMNILSYM